MFASKRGVSPLVATIFFIAVFVSVGAVLLNVGKGFVVADGGPCGMVQLNLVETCYDTTGQQIRFRFENVGTRTITGVKAQLFASKGATDKTVSLIVEEAGVGQSSIVFPEDKYGSIDRATFIPVADEDLCRESGVTVEDVVVCR